MPRTLISVDASDTREVGNEIMSASWASHLYTREICACVEKAGVSGHSTQGTFTCTKLLGINCDATIPDGVHIKNL